LFRLCISCSYFELVFRVAYKLTIYFAPRLHSARIASLQTHIPLLGELASGLLRAKHETRVLKLLNIDVAWRVATVGHLWKADLRRHAAALRQTLEQAQGEAALEAYLAEVSATWEHTAFATVKYKGRCHLVRNADALYAALTGFLADLASMKHSAYYAPFEADVLKWESLLNAAQATLEAFSDVQRRWVYLEGIFLGNADVQQQVAYQFKRFRAFDADFIRLLRDVSKRKHMFFNKCTLKRAHTRARTHTCTYAHIRIHTFVFTGAPRACALAPFALVRVGPLSAAEL
jgi:hypothetical protein